MTKKSLLLVGALAVFSLSVASAKSYDIALSSPTMVGASQLPAGTYTLKVEGSNAVITDAEHNTSVTAPVKIENVDKKYDVTAVETAAKGEVQQLNAIELGGSKTKLDFH